MAIALFPISMWCMWTAIWQLSGESHYVKSFSLWWSVLNEKDPICRHARGREEWESAALQNANTKCNGLLPLWGPQVPESVFASCLARHNTYLQECTGVRDANYPYTIHDLKHLVLKFAQEKSFSEDSGGGGRESNILLLPYVIHMALYVMNTSVV